MANQKITELTNLATPAGADLFAMVDDVAGTPTTKKATLTNVEAVIDHDALANFVSNEHINHTSVTLTAGTGLTGGGDISSNRTFAVDGLLEDLDTLGACSADSEFLVGTGAGALAWESGSTARASMGAGTLSNISEDTTPELGGEMDCGANTIGFTQQTATGDGSTTIDWKLGNKFKFTFGAQNDTFTFTAPSNPCNILLMLVQDGTGSRTATWPGTVKWPGGSAPTLTTGANSIDIIAFYYDGTNYYGVESLDFS